MTQDWGYTVPPSEGGGEIMHAVAEADRPRHGDSKGPADWARKNLFNTWYNSVITVVFAALSVYLAYRGLRFVFVTARWEPVRANLELFMVATFPRSERVRIVIQLLMTSGAVGLFAGWLRARAIRQADLAGLERPSSSWREQLGVYGALLAFVAITLVIGARTAGPWLVALGCVIAGATGFAATLPVRHHLQRVVLLSPYLLAAGVLTQVQDLDNAAAYLLATACALVLVAVSVTGSISGMLSASLLFGVAGFQAMSGTGGISWLFVTLALLPLALELLDRAADGDAATLRWVGLLVVVGALVWRATVEVLGVTTVVLAVLAVVTAVDAVRGSGSLAVRSGGIVTVAVASWAATRRLDVPGIDWSNWGGLHLSIIVAVASITLAFPVGLLLALARRSTLPALRVVSTVYIEIIRGVPLISLLLMGQFFIGFFLDSDTPLSNVTRATTAITMFSAAYIAEIVRGGLQSVPKGQTEAGQALGLAPAKITRLLVLPQALRAVIPAMVGQFISLFKDTSLLVIISITEFLGVREIVHSQEAFRGFGIAETLVFVGFGFWALSYTMSRESQRLERRLGVGLR